MRHWTKTERAEQSARMRAKWQAKRQASTPTPAPTHDDMIRTLASRGPEVRMQEIKNEIHAINVAMGGL